MVGTDVKAVLERLVQIAPPAISQICKPGQPHCVLSTSVGLMVLNKLGIHAEPFVAEVHICNQAWMQWADHNFAGGREEQLRRGAYLLTNTPNWQGASFKSVKVDKPWDGHLVLRVPDDQRTWLVDLDLGSFNRPQYNVKLPQGMMAIVRDNTVAGTFTQGGTRTAVAYRPLDAPYANDYQTARDWVERDRFDEIVEKLAQVVGNPYPLRP